MGWAARSAFRARCTFPRAVPRGPPWSTNLLCGTTHRRARGGPRRKTSHTSTRMGAPAAGEAARVAPAAVRGIRISYRSRCSQCHRRTGVHSLCKTVRCHRHRLHICRCCSPARSPPHCPRAIPEPTSFSSRRARGRRTRRCRCSPPGVETVEAARVVARGIRISDHSRCSRCRSRTSDASHLCPGRARCQARCQARRLCTRRPGLARSVHICPCRTRSGPRAAESRSRRRCAGRDCMGSIRRARGCRTRRCRCSPAGLQAAAAAGAAARPRTRSTRSQRRR